MKTLIAFDVYINEGRPSEAESCPVALAIEDSGLLGSQMSEALTDFNR